MIKSLNIGNINLAYHSSVNGMSNDLKKTIHNVIPQNILKQIKTISLDDRSMKGWWNKCLLFKPGFLSGSCLYLDLDMIIVKNNQNAYE